LKELIQAVAASPSIAKAVEDVLAVIDGVGFEARFIDNGELYCSRVFPTRDLAIEDAEWEKRQLLGAGVAGTAPDAGLIVSFSRCLAVRDEN
jgi:hypothetical protein